jgi:hypothetical protein
MAAVTGSINGMYEGYGTQFQQYNTPLTAESYRKCASEGKIDHPGSFADSLADRIGVS